ncbi:uncharacterized protein M421DRAFT_9470 [Didymella exigua CBS 183.55]|uniref:Aminoglycoside phosphotransferase domain-containing protein n=1 Tax=Didymella exigua CBS 183.55 TaxID=1150837 RepID=A0A6A5R7G2_9PLEO|nr:uncharacterized protein M421DRAFT_9470 [Didymella exigua CBS 183.55]KAF1923682.1 hypothetical protein M421DRAFT_9470 [Didymella exigua CBS 183.55]
MLTKFLDHFRPAKEASQPPEFQDEVESELEKELESHEEDDDGDDDTGHPRCDWETIDAIPESRYIDLVSRTCTFSGPLKEARCLAYKRGTFNAVSYVGVLSRGRVDLYIVRVPGHATVNHWTAQDKYMMQREVETIEYMNRYTSAPVPQVCTYSGDFTNILGHPFIMMTHLPGKSAHRIWFDEEYDDDPDTNFRLGDLPSPAVEKKRITFLRSLAKAMAEINTLSFNETGMPIIPLDGSVAPSIGAQYQWDNSGSNDYIERPVCASTPDYVRARPSSMRMLDALIADTKTQNYILGARKVLDMIFAQPVFNPSECKETFTLHHSDLDLQNILVDDEGNVTGIIDWDRCATVPRCVGAASAPLFLQKDWMPAYLNNLETAPHLGFTTHRYRQIYAAALAEQGCEDAKFTTKSAMYQAAAIALYDRDCGDIDDFLGKVLRCVPEFRGNVKETTRAFGMGWPAGERLLQRHLKQIFEPEMPDSNVLAEAEADIAAMEWMIGFEYAIEDVCNIDDGCCSLPSDR